MPTIDELRKRTPSTGPVADTQQPTSDGGIYGVSGKLATATVWLTPGKPGGRALDNSVLPHQPGQSGTVEEVLAEFYQFSPAFLQGMQAQLMQAGFFGKNDNPQPGVPDADTFRAYKEAVIRAARSQSPLFTVLGMSGEGGFTADPSILEPEKEPLPPLPQFGTVERVVQHTNDQSIKGAAESAFRAALGRKPTAKELSKFRETFLSAEEDYQRTEFDAQDSALLADRDQGMRAQEAQAAQATGSGDTSLDGFMLALSGQESGGTSDPANVQNARTGAHGIFQIMPNNWAPWAKEAGLPADAPKTPENQRLVARFKLAQYKRQYGSWEAVAVAWYAGPAAAKQYAADPTAARFSRKVQGGKEPSINEYVTGVMSKVQGSPTVRAGAPTNPDSAERWVDPAVPIDDASGLPSVNPVSTTRESVAPPSLSDSAQEAAENTDPAGFQAHNVTTVFDTFLRMLQSPV